MLNDVPEWNFLEHPYTDDELCVWTSNWEAILSVLGKSFSGWHRNKCFDVFWVTSVMAGKQLSKPTTKTFPFCEIQLKLVDCEGWAKYIYYNL